MTLKQLATLTGLTFDGDLTDTRLHLDDMIRIYPQYMTKPQYNKMTKHVDSIHIIGDGFEVYAWYDVSGYDYWKRDGDGNYLQVTASITDITKVNPDSLLDAVNNLYCDLSDSYDNLDTHLNFLNKRA